MLKSKNLFVGKNGVFPVAENGKCMFESLYLNPSKVFYVSTGFQLIHDSGFAPLRVGGIDQSIRIEVFGDLHEFGALGKTVTLEEAKEQVKKQAVV